jgi:hypothetical protein
VKAIHESKIYFVDRQPFQLEEAACFLLARRVFYGNKFSYFFGFSGFPLEILLKNC